MLHILLILALGLAIGILVGMMGLGGGILAVPALVYLLGMNQHLAQGTSLLLLLPPLGVGALYTYWKRGFVNVRAGVLCTVGFLVGGYLGGFLAIRIPSRELRTIFGVFLIFSAFVLWSQRGKQAGAKADA
jgi:uncharacterized protein